MNHNGNIETAHRLIDVAADSGADAVKFQTFRASELATAAAPKARYQTQTTDSGSQFDMLRSLELSDESHFELARHAAQRSILFSSTAFSPEGVDLLSRLGVPFFKIPSGEITNYPLVTHIAQQRRPVILSTGMSTLEEIETAVEWLGNGPEESALLPPLTVLHCITSYPAPASEINLRCIETLRRDLALPVGYSDHSAGTEISIAAAAMGAEVIEKHFTLDRKLAGPDHSASLEPSELASLISAIRNVTASLGDGVKRPAESERENLLPVRRAIVARRSIVAGEAYTPENVAVRRPAVGLPASEWPEVIGRLAPRNFSADEPIEL